MSEEPLRIERRAQSLRFWVRVAPRASREAILGVHDGALKIALTAPPVGGKANAALLSLLAKALRCPRRALRITHGQSGKSKGLEVEDADDALEARLRALASG